VENPALGRWRDEIVHTVLAVNPMAAAAFILDGDWLRQNVLYEACVIGRFYPFEYPAPSAFVACHLIVATGLLAMAVLPRRRAWRGNHRAR
jgi:hypothetical protein